MMPFLRVLISKTLSAQRFTNCLQQIAVSLIYPFCLPSIQRDRVSSSTVEWTTVTEDCTQIQEVPSQNKVLSVFRQKPEENHENP
jgi:hypothetical protein